LQKNIVPFIQDSDEELSDVLITECMSTNVKSLMWNGHYVLGASSPLRYEHFLEDVLKGLDYLAVHDLVHRDIKPENIFANPSQMHEDDYDYKIGDFGLIEHITSATNNSGSHYFKAPEVRCSKAQLPNADVYSLYATLVMVKDVQGYRRYSLHASKRPEYPDLSDKDVVTSIEGTRKHPALVKWAKMAEQDPEKRPSAGGLLEEHFRHVGRAQFTRQILQKRRVFKTICRPKYNVAPPLIPPPSATKENAERKRKLYEAALGADNLAQYDATELDALDKGHLNKRQKLDPPDPAVLKSLSDSRLDEWNLAIAREKDNRAFDPDSQIDSNFSEGPLPKKLLFLGHGNAAEHKRADALAPSDALKSHSKNVVPGKSNAKRDKSKKGHAKSGLTSRMGSARV
jgi:serine/threonine protein kinase